MQACFWKVCSEMSNAKLVGCAQRQLAILALGGNRRSSVAARVLEDGRPVAGDVLIERDPAADIGEKPIKPDFPRPQFLWTVVDAIEFQQVEGIEERPGPNEVARRSNIVTALWPSGATAARRSGPNEI